MDWNSRLPLTIPQVLAVADTIPSRLFLWRNKMNEEIMNEIQPVRPKDQFTFSCRQCGACCRNIEGCVMVESLDAYRLARYLRAKGKPIEGIEDFLFRYCEPEPLLWRYLQNGQCTAGLCPASGIGVRSVGADWIPSCYLRVPCRKTA